MSVHFRLDAEVRSRVQEICSQRGICESDFYRECLSEGLNSWDPTMSIRQSTSVGPTSQFIPHNSHPGIKLVKSIEEKGTTYYIDTEGHKWRMDKDRTLIAIGRLIERGNGKFDVLFK